MGVGRMLLSLDYEAADGGAEAALAFAGPCQAISLGIDVEPSTEPAALVLLHQGEPLPQKPLVRCLPCASPDIRAPAASGNPIPLFTVHQWCVHPGLHGQSRVYTTAGADTTADTTAPAVVSALCLQLPRHTWRSGPCLPFCGKPRSYSICPA